MPSISMSAARTCSAFICLLAVLAQGALYLGHVSTPEPFNEARQPSGMILGEDNQKMSNRGPESVVNPDDVVRDYGDGRGPDVRDVHGPLEATSVEYARAGGCVRFLGRVWRLFCDEDGKLILDDTEPAGTTSQSPASDH